MPAMVEVAGGVGVGVAVSGQDASHRRSAAWFSCPTHFLEFSWTHGLLGSVAAWSAWRLGGPLKTLCDVLRN